MKTVNFRDFPWPALTAVMAFLPGKKPQNGGGIGRMLMPSKGTLFGIVSGVFFPFSQSVLASFSCFSKVLVRQWVDKMDLVDTRPKERVGQEIQQGMI